MHTVTAQPLSEQILKLDPAVRIGKLPNGFTYFIRKNLEPKHRVQLYLANKVGSILETEDQQGLAHFLEHMSFNGTKHFPKNELVSYLEKAGVRFGSDLNAYTSFDETVYQLPIPSDDSLVFANGMQIMRDWAQDATLETEEINKERGIILQEKRQGGSASKRMSDKYLPILLNESRYSKRLPIGTDEVLNNFKPNTLRQFYKDWYRPDLQALIVVGDIDVDYVEKVIKSKFSDLKVNPKAKERTVYTVPLTSKNQFITVTDKEFTYTAIQVYSKLPSLVIKTASDFNESIKRSLFNQMLGARFSELSKQSDPPFIQGGAQINGLMANIDAFNVFMVAKPNETEKGFKAVWKEVERVKQIGFTESELKRAKQNLMISLESALKEKNNTHSSNLVNEYLNYFLNNQAAPGIDKEYSLVKEFLPLITIHDLNQLTEKYILEVNRDILVLGNESDNASLPNEITVQQWINDINNEKLELYVDQVSDKPLISKKPIAGKIIIEKVIDELDITEFTLNNGVRVILKPTDFKKDEIRFFAFSPGGTSLYSDSDFQSATNAAGIVSSGGLGDFNSIELPKVLNGKIVNISPYIRELSEGIQGYTSPADLETALTLLNMYFTAPRKDSTVFKGIISQSSARILNRSNDPNSVFNDTISAILGNYNIRRTGPSINKLKQINLDRAYEIYKERFADASDFTFIFVGNFNTSELKPSIEQWLGSLPALNRVEKAKDLGIKTPSGRIQKTVYKGIESKASVHLVFSGEYNYNLENNTQLAGLGEVLQFKLTERLRELESGVYNPSARASYNKFPSSTYSITLSFNCAVENVEKLIAASLDEINKLITMGPALVEIQKFRTENTRGMEVQLKDNGFWLRYLGNTYENNEDPKSILDYSKRLTNVTQESIRAAATKYLSGNNLIRLVLLPDQKASTLN